jgi:Ca-activated chloride channel family protein
MKFAEPWALVLLVVPVWALLLVVRNRGRVRADAIRFANAPLLDALRIAPVASWRRKMPFIALQLALCCSVLAAADPQRLGPVESANSTVVLALDVSRSMLATDVSPSRIDAARAATLAFIDAAPSTTRVGLVVFSSRVDIAAVPTLDRKVLRDAVANLATDGGTAIGDAIFTSLSLLDTAGWEPDPNDPTRSVQRRAGAIVVMSDGSTNTGRPDVDAAAAAKVAGVPVYTVAFGTPQGVITVDGASLPVPAAPEPLAEIAGTTNASVYEAFTGAELSSVFANLAATVAVQQGMRSFAHLLALVAVCFAALAAWGWVRFGPRV